MSENEHDIHIEVNKLYYDFLKHLATLSTGSIVILASIIGSVFKNPEWVMLVVYVFVLLSISIVSSALGMFTIVSYLETKKKKERSLSISYTITSGFSFVCSLILFCLFSAKNFLA
jgi:hypothetical protein